MEHFEYMNTMMDEVREWEEAQQEEDTCDEAEWADIICDQDDWIDLHDDPDYETGFDPYLGCYTDDC